METQELKRIVEALIFAADEPLSAERILETIEIKNGLDLASVIDELNREYQQSGRAFMIRQVAGGYQIATQPDYSSWIRKLYLGRHKSRLSQAALETLAIIAFKQPISRVEIAQIRGVNSDGVIGTLLERRLVTISGRAEGVGRPLLYSTTSDFLKYFGLNEIADLPKPREIEELFGKEGMPEEIIQALSQTEAQLSLPMHAEEETLSPGDETTGIESKSKTPPPEERASPVAPISESTTLTSDGFDAPSASQSSEAETISGAESSVDETNADDQTDELGPSDIERDEIAPEKLAAGIEELFEESISLAAAVEESGDSPTVVGDDEVFNNSLFGSNLVNSELSSDPAEEVDGWLAEEFSQEDIAEPEILLKAEALLADDLQAAPLETPRAVDVDAKFSATAEGEPAPASNLSPSPSRDEVFQDAGNDAYQSDRGKSFENVITVEPASEEQTGELLEVAAIEELEAESLHTSSEVVDDDSTQEETTAPAFSPSPAADESQVSENTLTLTVEERTDALLALPDAENASDETIILNEDSHNLLQQNAATGTAFAATNNSAKNEAENAPLRLADNNQAQHVQITPRALEDIPKANNRWLSLREKTFGWIKRTFDRLVALVGSRLAPRA